MRTLLVKFGFSQLEGSGSRVKFYHKENNRLISLHRPHPSDIVKKGAIRDVVSALKDMGIEP